MSSLTPKIQDQLEHARRQTGDASIDLADNMDRWEDGQDGVLCAVFVGRTRFKTQLTAEDLGLNTELQTDPELAGLFRLGQKHLLPENILRTLDNLEHKMRDLLEIYGFPGIMGKSFVPFQNYSRLKSELEHLASRYYDVRDSIRYNYERIKAEMGERYTALARKTYQDLRKRKEAGADFYLENEEMFVANFVQGILKRFPSEEQITASFVVELTAQFMPRPLAVEEELAKARELAYQRQLGGDTVKRDQARLKAETAQYERQAAAHMTAEEFYLSSLREATQDALRQMQADLDQTVTQFPSLIQDRLLNTLLAGCNDVLFSIRDKGKLSPGNIKSLRKMIEDLGNLNFINHETVSAAMQRIEESLNASAAAGKYNTGSLEQTLEDIGIAVRANLAELNITVRTGKELIIPEVTPEKLEVVRRRIFEPGLPVQPDMLTFAGRRQQDLL